MALSEQDKYALAALLHDPNGVPRFAEAGWIGWCPRGHIVISNGSQRYTHPCTTLINQSCGMLGVAAEWIPCRQFYNPMPNQDTLLAVFRLGGWDAMVEAAQAMIASG